MWICQIHRVSSSIRHNYMLLSLMSATLWISVSSIHRHAKERTPLHRILDYHRTASVGCCQAHLLLKLWYSYQHGVRFHTRLYQYHNELD